MDKASPARPFIGVSFSMESRWSRRENGRQGTEWFNVGVHRVYLFWIPILKFERFL